MAKVKKWLKNIGGVVFIIFFIYGCYQTLCWENNRVFIDPKPPEERELRNAGFGGITEIEDDIIITSYTNEDFTKCVTYTIDTKERIKMVYVVQCDMQASAFVRVGSWIHTCYIPARGDYIMKVYEIPLPKEAPDA